LKHIPTLNLFRFFICPQFTQTDTISNLCQPWTHRTPSSLAIYRRLMSRW